MAFVPHVRKVWSEMLKSIHVSSEPTHVIASNPLADDVSSASNRSDRTRFLLAAHAAETSEFRRKHIADEIVEINRSVAHSIAHRYRDRGELVEDLEQVACLGLVKAVYGFDPSRGLDFLVYAVPTISGEVKRHFRDRCWVVRPTRRIQELKSQISGCTEMLRQALGHAPLAAEIADYLGENLDDVNEALSADSCFLPASLDIRVGESGSSSRGELIGETDPEFDRAEIRSLLRPCLDKLSAEDRQIVAHRFVDQWTQEQIAQDLGVSQMQVSRRLGRIMLALRNELGEDMMSA